MYRQIKQAQSKFNQNVSEFNDQNAKLYFASDYIMTEIITNAGVLQFAEAVNPIDEINLASRTIKSGPNGVNLAPLKSFEFREYVIIHNSNLIYLNILVKRLVERYYYIYIIIMI